MEHKSEQLMDELGHKVDMVELLFQEKASPKKKNLKKIKITPESMQQRKYFFLTGNPPHLFVL